MSMIIKRGSVSQEAFLLNCIHTPFFLYNSNNRLRLSDSTVEAKLVKNPSSQIPSRISLTRRKISEIQRCQRPTRLLSPKSSSQSSTLRGRTTRAGSSHFRPRCAKKHATKKKKTAGRDTSSSRTASAGPSKRATRSGQAVPETKDQQSKDRRTNLLKKYTTYNACHDIRPRYAYTTSNYTNF